MKKSSLLLFLLFLFHQVSAQIPKAETGVLDLHKWDFERDGVVKLSGEWQFYYRDFLSQKSLDSLPIKNYINVPSKWESFKWENNYITGHGIATYRLTVLLPKKKKQQHLTIRSLDLSSSYELFVNGELLGGKGKVGKTAEEAIPKMGVFTKSFDTKSDTLTLIVYVSNFSHKSGGMWHSIEIGYEEQVFNFSNQLFSLDTFIIGCILIMSFYHFMLFFLHKKEISNLYFAFFCIGIILRIMSTNERYITVFNPDMDWEMIQKMSFGSFYFITLVIVFYMESLFPKDKILFISLFFRTLSMIGLLLVMFTYADVYTRLLEFNYSLILFIIIYLMAVLVRATLRKQYMAFGLLVAFGISTLAVVQDILFDASVINTFYVSSYAFVFFLIFQIFVLSLKSSNDFLRIENLSDELKLMNENLEKLIKERTRQLNEANEELNQMNENLENKIKERTQKLEHQKDRLAEYAFINAHKLRGPLASILGLLNLFNMADLKADEKELLNHLVISTKMLDDVIEQINNVLDEEKHYRR